MKLGMGLGVVLLNVLAVSAQPLAAPATPSAPAAADIALPVNATPLGPRIKFAEPIFDFGRIKSGEVVKHTYAFTNIGDQVLEIQHVQPSCGCTAMGEWSRRVEPGQAGSIPVQFNSANFNGAVFKTISVACNDKTQPSHILQLKGTIWKPIDVAPQFAVLNIPPDAPSASTTVKIINNTEEPVTLSPPESSNPAFAAEIKTNQPGKEYELTVSTKSSLPPGNVQGVITLKTSSTNLPVVTVTVWANVQPVVAIMPPQITLPPAPLVSKTLPSVTIQNNTTNMLSLSEPQINLPDVDVTLQEILPGRAFSATLAFPAGFTLPPGQPAVFTVKTSHPKYPVVRVPIVQMPRPAVLPAPAAATPPPPAPRASAGTPAPPAPPPLPPSPVAR
mgnify:CR=1 FL=1